MQAAELIDQIASAGGRVWLEGDKVRARLPEALRPMVNVLRERRPELAIELERRAAFLPPDIEVPDGVTITRWEAKLFPIQVSQSERIADAGLAKLFVAATLRELKAELHGVAKKHWLTGHWGGVAGLLHRLAAVGVVVEIDEPKRRAR